MLEVDEQHNSLAKREYISFMETMQFLFYFFLYLWFFVCFFRTYVLACFLILILTLLLTTSYYFYLCTKDQKVNPVSPTLQDLDAILGELGIDLPQESYPGRI